LAVDHGIRVASTNGPRVADSPCSRQSVDQEVRVGRAELADKLRRSVWVSSDTEKVSFSRKGSRTSRASCRSRPPYPAPSHDEAWISGCLCGRLNECGHRMRQMIAPRYPRLRANPPFDHLIMKSPMLNTMAFLIGVAGKKTPGWCLEPR
jgi:hypothetical protein